MGLEQSVFERRETLSDAPSGSGGNGLRVRFGAHHSSVLQRKAIVDGVTKPLLATDVRLRRLCPARPTEMGLLGFATRKTQSGARADTRRERF